MPIKVYIDQGHNPRDYNTGAEGNGYFEQDITYEVGRLLYNYLDENPDFSVVLVSSNGLPYYVWFSVDWERPKLLYLPIDKPEEN